MILGRHRFRINLLLILLIVSSLSIRDFTSSNGKISLDAEEKLLIWANPNTLGQDNSPVDVVTNYGGNYMNSIYNGLLRRTIESDRAHAPDLASAMPIVSSDFKNWTFTLRPGLKFSDGSDLNASSVVFSYQVQLTSSIDSNAGFLAQYFTTDSIFAIDTLTVQFNMLKPYAFAPTLFSRFIFSEDHFGPMLKACVGGTTSACDWNTDLTGGNLVGGSGAFMIDKYDTTNNIIELVPNPNYYMATQIKLDRIVFRTIIDPTAAKVAFASGDTNIFDPEYRAKVADFSQLSGIRDVFVGAPKIEEMLPNHLHPYFGLGSYSTTGINTRTDFSSNANQTAARNIRKAMSHMIDRVFIANEISGGLSSPVATIMPSISIGWDSSILPRTYDINVAKAHMETAGFDYTVKTFDNVTGAMDAPFFSITIMSPIGNPEREQWAAFIAVELPKIGIGVLQNLIVPYSSLLPRTFKYPGLPPVYEEGGYDVFFIGWSFDLDFNPSGLYEKEFQNPNCCNVYNYDNSTVEGAIADYVAELDAVARITKIKLVQDLLYDDQPSFAIVSGIDHWVWGDNIVGLNGLSMSQRDFQWELVDMNVVGPTTPTTPGPITSIPTSTTSTITSTSDTTDIITSTLTSSFTSFDPTSQMSTKPNTIKTTSTESSVSPTPAETSTAILPISIFSMLYGLVITITIKLFVGLKTKKFEK